MKQSKYRSYDELPLFLNVNILSDLLGISLSAAYELMHEANFPSLKIGSRLVIPKDKFIKWADDNTGGKENLHS